MPLKHFSVPVITSGLCGGMSKIITTQIPIAAITFQNIFDVALYAVLSAIIGYGVNKGIDTIAEKIQHPKKSKRPRK